MDLIHNPHIDEETGSLFLKGRVTMPNNQKARGGFISLKGKHQANWADYHSIEMKVKNNVSENLRLTFNMTCDSLIQNDMYQQHVEIVGGGDMSKIRIPFGSFQLTHLGYDRVVQRKNDSLQVQALGLLITSQLQNKTFKQGEEVVYDEMSDDDVDDNIDDENMITRERRNKDFEFDLEILEMTVLTYEADEERKLEDRKEYLRQKMRIREDEAAAATAATTTNNN